MERNLFEGLTWLTGVLTATWVMTALADRFLLMASLLPKEVYCRSRSKQSTFSATFLRLNSTKYTTNLRLCLTSLKHQMRKIVYKLLLLPGEQAAYITAPKPAQMPMEFLPLLFKNNSKANTNLTKSPTLTNTV